MVFSQKYDTLYQKSICLALSDGFTLFCFCGTINPFAAGNGLKIHGGTYCGDGMRYLRMNAISR